MARPSAATDLSSAWCPVGAVLDEATKLPETQLKAVWARMSYSERRVVIAYEKLAEVGATAKACNLKQHEVRAILDNGVVRQATTLRQILLADTLPPTMIGRMLSMIAISPTSSDHAKIRALTELARVQGVYQSSTPVIAEDDAPATMDEQSADRIVEASGQTMDIAALLRETSARALAQGKNIEAVQAAAKGQREVEAMPEPDPLDDTRRPEPEPELFDKAKVRPIAQRKEPRSVIGSVPESLANPDVRAKERQDWFRNSGSGTNG